jgi:hypothetical protein
LVLFCLKKLQFTNQNKNGINRIYLVSLIEKMLTMQVYEAKNHLEVTDEQNITKNQSQNESKHSENENTNGNSLKNSA